MSVCTGQWEESWFYGGFNLTLWGTVKNIIVCWEQEELQLLIYWQRWSPIGRIWGDWRGQSPSWFLWELNTFLVGVVNKKTNKQKRQKRLLSAGYNLHFSCWYNDSGEAYRKNMTTVAIEIWLNWNMIPLGSGHALLGTVRATLVCEKRDIWWDLSEESWFHRGSLRELQRDG